MKNFLLAILIFFTSTAFTVEPNPVSILNKQKKLLQLIPPAKLKLLKCFGMDVFIVLTLIHI